MFKKTTKLCVPKHTLKTDESSSEKLTLSLPRGRRAMVVVYARPGVPNLCMHMCHFFLKVACASVQIYERRIESNAKVSISVITLY